MDISKLENSQVSHMNSREKKKSKSGKITGAVLGAALSGMYFSEINKDGNFLKSIKNYQKISGKMHPLAGFTLVCAIIFAPFVAIGATLDGVIDAVRKESFKKSKTKQQKQIDVMA